MPTRLLQRGPGRKPGFTLVEVVTSLIILGLTCSSVLVIMNRNMQSAYDVTMRLRALEVARENLEAILVSQSVEEMTETGATETSPPIEWESTVETFYAPVNGQTWARARCRADYEDMEGQQQSVELEHWLTMVTDAQLQALDNLTSEESASFSTVEEAAAYAGVSQETIEDWVDKGMVLTDGGLYIKENLDLFIRTDGDPTPEEIAQQQTTVKSQDMPFDDAQDSMPDDMDEVFPEDQADLDIPEGQFDRERMK